MIYFQIESIGVLTRSDIVTKNKQNSNRYLRHRQVRKRRCKKKTSRSSDRIFTFTQLTEIVTDDSILPSTVVAEDRSMQLAVLPTLPSAGNNFRLRFERTRRCI